MGAFPHFNRNFRYSFTVNSAEVDENLTDYPVYLDLSIFPADFFNNVKSDGGDIIITTSTDDRLPIEVVFVNTSTNTGEVYFKTNISSTVDTEFYIYFGNNTATQPAVTDIYGRNAVWSNGYGAVYHLQDAVNNYALTTDSFTGVTNPDNVNGTPDGNVGEWTLNGQVAVYDFGEEFPVGTKVKLTWRKVATEPGGDAIPIIGLSTTNSGFTDQGNPISTSSTTLTTQEFNSTVSFRYIEITKNAVPSTIDFEIDAIQVGEDSQGVVDSTGNGNTGTATGIFEKDVNAATQGGEGLVFDGTTSRINIGQDSSIKDFASNQITLSAWFKTVTVGDNRVVSAFDGNASDDWALRTGEAGNFFTSRLNAANQIENSAAVDDGNLHFAVMTFESGDRRTIRDGTNVVSSTPTFTINNNNEDVFIGDRAGGNRKFDGTIDEVRIADVVRTNGWVSTEYNNFTEAGFFSVDATLETYNFITRFRNG